MSKVDPPNDEDRGEDHGYNDASASGATKRQRLSALDQRLEALRSIMPLSTARRLIAELEKENKCISALKEEIVKLKATAKN